MGKILACLDFIGGGNREVEVEDTRRGGIISSVNPQGGEGEGESNIQVLEGKRKFHLYHYGEVKFVDLMTGNSVFILLAFVFSVKSDMRTSVESSEGNNGVFFFLGVKNDL